MKLIQLPNGNWVRPDTITSIAALPAEKGPFPHGSIVLVHHGKAYCEALKANDDEHARTMAGELATLINNEKHP